MLMDLIAIACGVAAVTLFLALVLVWVCVEFSE